MYYDPYQNKELPTLKDAVAHLKKNTPKGFYKNDQELFQMGIDARWIVHKGEEIQVLIVPSSEEERDYEENCIDFDQALARYREVRPSNGTSLITFSSEREARAFIWGYKHAIGYLGQGLYYTKNC